MFFSIFLFEVIKTHKILTLNHQGDNQAAIGNYYILHIKPQIFKVFI